MFLMNNKQRTGKKRIGAGATMEGEFWSKRMKIQVVRSEE
jgi:hypothetical protein